MSDKYYYITTPIYYVNDKPHIGHAYTNIAADILARFKRLDNYNVIFLTGTDEHGQKIEASAKKNNMLPQDFVDEVSKTFLSLCNTLNLSNDDFIRTTQNRHKSAVIALYKSLWDNGYIYKDTYKGWYCVSDEAFYAPEELIDGGNGEKLAPSGAKVEFKEEENYFFKLSAFQDELLKHYDNNPNFIAPKSRFNEVYSFVKGGLRDLAISRSTFNWGIKTPNDENHIIYVWLDALTNYLSAINYPNIDDDKFKNYWNKAIHLVGKDIIRFHCVYFPAFLMAAKLPLPKRIFAHGWWLNNGEKISKSKGNAIDPNDLIATYSQDALRYFLFKEVPFGNDGDFSHNAIIAKINNELANEYGNLVQRSLSIVHKSFGGILNNNLNQEQKDYLQSTQEILQKCKDMINKEDIHHYIEEAWKIIKYGNMYMEKTAPWSLIKNNQLSQAQGVLYFICELIRRASMLLNPIMPHSTQLVYNQLNVSVDKLNFNYFNSLIENNHKINIPSIIFKKIDTAEQ